MRRSNYDKYPSINIEGNLIMGWNDICKEVCKKLKGMPCHAVCVVECYQGIYMDELEEHISQMGFDKMVCATDSYKPEEEIRRLTQPWVTDDRLFGYKSFLTYQDFFDDNKLTSVRTEISKRRSSVLVYGAGAAYLCPEADIVIYMDMPRWEIQQRFRRKEIDNLGINNRTEDSCRLYKRGYFVDWHVCDELKKKLLPVADFWIDSCIRGLPKMVTGAVLRNGLVKAAHQPFRVVPFFDPAPWGGQWMKEVCDLDRSRSNFGWCFDCVPEENSLYFKVDNELFEIPANNLVFYQTDELLGAPVESRFGQDFPIRFDFLDTMGGGNLSLQVHPTTQYIHETFGMHYTQDESYYLLDAEPDACVYLGLKTGIDPDKMIEDLNKAQQSNVPFDVDKYVNRWHAKKHDHFLIPNGTVHCSGSGSMVLEISATPNIFTFKLYDWRRLGLDGIPRPINIGHGKQVIQWERQSELIKKEFINAVEMIDEGDGWIEERTGLHRNEFIETRRHWFTKTVCHTTNGGVNVLNLVEGDEVIVESPIEAFDAFVVHYAETFIIPASIEQYTIRPHGISEGKRCATIKAYIRFEN